MKAKQVRKASPPRPESEDTFRKKLDEIKRMRQKQTNEPKTKVVVNGKPALEVQGDWALFFSASKGKKYYFNLKTLVNQWTKPDGWIGGEEAKPKPQTSARPPSPQPPNGTNGSGFKMKLKKVKKKKIPAVEKPPEVDPRDKIPKAYMDFSDDDEPKTKLPKLDDHNNGQDQEPKLPDLFENFRPEPMVPPAPPPIAVAPVPAVPEPQVDPLQQAVLAAKAKIESLLPTESSSSSGLTSANAHLNNATWISEYNFPAVLSRCKFPKTSDAVHELATNRNKNRTEPNLPPLPPEFASFAGSQFDVRRDMFLQELKNSNNKNRLLTDKMNGTTVFKIPDELWDRSYPMFCVELLGPNIKLECRPHGFTEEDVPVYTRTGKVANKLPYPEDIVRCHAVLQAWKTETCHCVYANRTYTIEKDDRQWKKDLEECKKFLIENGY